MLSRGITCALLLGTMLLPGLTARADSVIPAEAKTAYAAGDYARAIDILSHVASAYPRDAAVKDLLARCYFEDEQYDRAISAAESAVSLDAGNSNYHLLLGRAYGEKADRSGWFGALSL